MTYKPRQQAPLGAPLGRSIPNQGRVVIYKPKANKGQKMAFGRANRSLGKLPSAYNISVSTSDLEKKILAALQKEFVNYGGYDSYGRATGPYTAYAFPSEAAQSGKVPAGETLQGEIKGKYGGFFRMPNPYDQENPFWIKTGQVSELTQGTVNNQVGGIVTKVVNEFLGGSGGLKNPTVLAEMVATPQVVASRLVPDVKKAINGNAWFKSWGLTVS